MNPNIEKNFRYHPPTFGTSEAHAQIRAKAKELALLIDQLVPQDGAREKAVAQSFLESSMMWACAGIVRHSSSQGNEGQENSIPLTNHSSDQTPVSNS